MVHVHTHKRSVHRIVIGSLCILGSIFILATLMNSVFSLQSVEVIGDGIGIEINKELLHTNLLFIPIEQLRRQLLSEYVLLSDVEIQKKYPHTIRIVPRVRVPIVRLRTNAKIVLVDKDGWVINDETSPISVPTLEFDIGDVFTGMQVKDSRVLSSLAFLAYAPDDLPITRITALDNASLRVISDTIDIYIPQLSNMKKTGATLQTLRTGFRIKGKLPAVIDLRFDKPVVTF